MIPKRSLVVQGPQANNPIRKIPIDFNRISSGDHPRENIVLLPGDMLFVR